VEAFGKSKTCRASRRQSRGAIIALLTTRQIIKLTLRLLLILGIAQLNEDFNLSLLSH